MQRKDCNELMNKKINFLIIRDKIQFYIHFRISFLIIRILYIKSTRILYIKSFSRLKMIYNIICTNKYCTRSILN